MWILLQCHPSKQTASLNVVNDSVEKKTGDSANHKTSQKLQPETVSDSDLLSFGTRMKKQPAGFNREKFFITYMYALIHSRSLKKANHWHTLIIIRLYKCLGSLCPVPRTPHSRWPLWRREAQLSSCEDRTHARERIASSEKAVEFIHYSADQ